MSKVVTFPEKMTPERMKDIRRKLMEVMEWLQAKVCGGAENEGFSEGYFEPFLEYDRPSAGSVFDFEGRNYLVTVKDIGTIEQGNDWNAAVREAIVNAGGFSE